MQRNLKSERVSCGNDCGCGETCAISGEKIVKVRKDSKLDEFKENEILSAEYAEMFGVG
jgi:hypothetical protein